MNIFPIFLLALMTVLFAKVIYWSAFSIFWLIVGILFFPLLIVGIVLVFFAPIACLLGWLFKGVFKEHYAFHHYRGKKRRRCCSCHKGCCDFDDEYSRDTQSKEKESRSDDKGNDNCSDGPIDIE